MDLAQSRGGGGMDSSLGCTPRACLGRAVAAGGRSVSPG